MENGVASDMGQEATPPDPLEILMTGLDIVWRAEEGMVLPCLRTFLAVCTAAEREGRGVMVSRLAKSLGTHRTNVGRHLKFLRERGWIGTDKDSNDCRIDLNLPTEKGWNLYDSLRAWPPAPIS
jgi:DNA-binding MarR family transcriptional regulator